VRPGTSAGFERMAIRAETHAAPILQRASTNLPDELSTKKCRHHFVDNFFLFRPNKKNHARVDSIF
jgi:hypothetical protein